MENVIIIGIMALIVLAIIAVEMYVSSKRKWGENYKDIFRREEK